MGSPADVRDTSGGRDGFGRQLRSGGSWSRRDRGAASLAHRCGFGCVLCGLAYVDRRAAREQHLGAELVAKDVDPTMTCDPYVNHAAR